MSKPTLGYATRTDAVCALRLAGVSTAEIARRIGITAAQVRSLETSRRRCDAANAGARQHNTTTMQPVDLPKLQIIALRGLASRRNLSVDQLVRRIVGAVIDDDLVDAVLDDGER